MMRALRELDVRRLVVATLFVPLLLFSFFSVHTMPRFTDQGVEIVICTGSGMETVVASTDDDPSGKPSHAPCDWSMQIHAATLPASGITVLPVAFSRSVAVAFETTILRSRKIESGRHARAPPLSV